MMCEKFLKNQGNNTRCASCGGSTIIQHGRAVMSDETKKKRKDYGF